MDKRNRYDIISDILKVAEKGAIKTRIVYQSNLNFKLVDKYLGLLDGLEMIRHEGRKYYTTEKGLKQIETMNDLHISLGEFI